MLIIKTTIKKGQSYLPLTIQKNSSLPAIRCMLGDKKGDFCHDTRNAACRTFLGSNLANFNNR